jgi:hypothetical protein
MSGNMVRDLDNIAPGASMVEPPGEKRYYVPKRWKGPVRVLPSPRYHPYSMEKLTKRA